MSEYRTIEIGGDGPPVTIEPPRLPPCRYVVDGQPCGCSDAEEPSSTGTLAV